LIEKIGETKPQAKKDNISINHFLFGHTKTNFYPPAEIKDEYGVKIFA